MEIYDVINAMNKVVSDDIGGHYVLHRSMEEQSIKLYKRFNYDLYLIKDKKKEPVLSFSQIVRLPSISIDSVWAEMDRLFLVQLLRFIYGKFKDELVSDTNN